MGVSQVRDVQEQELAPEQEAEDGEGADVGSASGDSGEDASDESDADEDDGLPDAEVLDLVERHTFVLPGRHQGAKIFLKFLSNTEQQL